MTRRLGPPGVRVRIPAELCLAALTEPIHVHDDDQVGQLVVGRFVEGFPHASLCELAVAAENPDAILELVEVLVRDGDAHTVRESLPKGTGGDIDPRQHRGGMALQSLSEPPVTGHQLVIGDDANGLEHRVRQR